MARWTILQTRDLTTAINEAILRKGFSFIEVLSPCPVNYGRRNKEKPIDTLKLYQDRTIVKNGADPARADIDFSRGVVIGKFVDRPLHLRRPVPGLLSAVRGGVRERLLGCR